MKFELDPESSEHSFWELDQFEHDSSHPDGAFCVPVLHSEREWQVCLLLYIFLYSVVVLCTDARFQTAWNGMLHQGLVHIQLWSNFNVFQMCLVVGGCSSAVRNTMKVATRLQDAARCSNWPILNTYSITQKHSLTQSHAFPWIHQVRRAIHLKFYRFSSESCTNLSFLISYSTNQQINHTINQASNPANDSINQKTPPSISISLPTGFLSGRLSHAVYQTLLIDFFETTGCSRICAGLCGPKALGMIPDSQQQNKPQQTMSNGCIYMCVYICVCVYIYAV